MSNGPCPSSDSKLTPFDSGMAEKIRMEKIAVIESDSFLGGETFDVMNDIIKVSSKRPLMTLVHEYIHALQKRWGILPDLGTARGRFKVERECFEMVKSLRDFSGLNKHDVSFANDSLFTYVPNRNRRFQFYPRRRF